MQVYVPRSSLSLMKESTSFKVSVGFALFFFVVAMILNIVSAAQGCGYYYQTYEGCVSGYSFECSSNYVAYCCQSAEATCGSDS